MLVVASEKLKAQEVPRSQLVVRFHEGREQLPIVELRQAAVLFVRAFGTFTNGLPSSYIQAATCGIRIGLVKDAPVKCLR